MLMKQLVKKCNQLQIVAQQQTKKTVPVSKTPKFFEKPMEKSLKKSIQAVSDSKDCLSSIPEDRDLMNITLQKSDFRSDQQQQYLPENTIINLNGDVVIGTLKKIDLHGKVIIKYQSGQYFQGIYNFGRRIFGKIIFKNGTQYFGNLFDNFFHGDGSLIDQKKRVISCKWNMGSPQKKAIIQYQSGDIYYGQIQKLQKHGQGILNFKNGNKYIGYFKNGKITGYGAFYENKKKVAQGIWDNGSLVTERHNTKKETQRLSIYNTILNLKQNPALKAMIK